jgi:glycosyltransferase involved in cell wall biosynthesis
VIPNPVLAPPSEKYITNEYHHGSKKIYRIISLGRLIPIKGFDRLIKAFSNIASSYPEWLLEIWGDGPSRIELNNTILSLHLEDRIKMPGITKDPYQELSKSDLFVMSSHTEGFPMALCEAMACGLPVIRFDCPSGPREIIRDGMDGILVPNDDIDALAKAMANLIENPDIRDQLAHNARDIVSRFGIEGIAAQWETVIDKALC